MASPGDLARRLAGALGAAEPHILRRGVIVACILVWIALMWLLLG